jgi:hypothetical protein
MAPRKLLVAVTSFACETKDGEVKVSGGQVVASNHPSVKVRESRFEPFTAPTGDAA